MSDGHKAMIKILELLQAKGWSLADFARKMNVQSAYVSNWKKRGIPSNRLPEAADALGVTIDFLAAQKTERPTGAISVTLSGRIPVVGALSVIDDDDFNEVAMSTKTEIITIPSNDASAYALKIEGTALMPRIQPGEYVIAEPSREAVPGDEVVITNQAGRVAIKRLLFVRDSNFFFGSINSDQKTAIIAQKAIKSIHPILAIVQSRFLV